MSARVFNLDLETPTVHESAYVDPRSSVIGRVYLGKRVYVAPFASIRSDEGQPILPEIRVSYRLRFVGEQTVQTNTSLAEAYSSGAPPASRSMSSPETDSETTRSE